MTGSVPASVLLLLWCVSNALCAERTESVGDAATVAPPVIPVGLDAYRLWERWPYQRLGVRAYMKGAYDRTGGNDDRSNYLYQDSAEFNVTLDEYGPGAVYFVRYHFWHGSPWHYEVDGVDHVISETTAFSNVRKKIYVIRSCNIPRRRSDSSIARSLSCKQMVRCINSSS